jgi:serine/threonine protein kinase
MVAIPVRPLLQVNDPKQGSRIGRYELVDVIGSGGMSTVYRARMWGPGQATKQVALKLIHPHLVNDNHSILMFLDEMQMTMALTHRNLVQTFDAGQAGELYFMVMELVEGCSLRQLINLARGAGPFPLDVALFISMEVCAALEYAHGFASEGSEPSGMVHRDVSPSNILLSRQGDVKLADFGVAKAAGRLAVSTITTIKGKLSYMAPEQARGQAIQRSDLFAVGAVLYEVITGQRARPERDLTTIARGTDKLRSPRELRPDLPAALEEVLLSCLAPSPSERPKNAAALRSALSDQLFALQQRDDLPTDPFTRLREFLGRLLQPPQAPQHTGSKANELAAAIMEQVRQVPTRTGASEQLEEIPAEQTQPTETPVLDTGRWRRVVVLGAAVVLLLLAAGVGVWLALSGDMEPPHVGPDVSRTVVVKAARADLNREPSLPLEGGAQSLPPRPRARRRSRRRRTAPTKQYGTLDLNAMPWASVYIDGKYRGETPIQGLRLAAGPHRVRLVNRKHGKRHSLRIEIQANRTLKKVVVMR